MTKEEKIKEAYGEYFEKCNPDENGWFWSENIIFSFCKNWDKIGYRKTLRFRPKSLSGIENNNGWNILKGIKNEITHDGDIWILNKHGNIELWLESQFLAIGYATHWKPVIKPKPPIY